MFRKVTGRIWFSLIFAEIQFGIRYKNLLDAKGSGRLQKKDSYQVTITYSTPEDTNHMFWVKRLFSHLQFGGSFQSFPDQKVVHQDLRQHQVILETFLSLQKFGVVDNLC